MLIHNQSQMSFPGHHPPGRHHGMHDPHTFNYAFEAAVEEALAARANVSQRRRTPPPCRYSTDACLPMADRLYWHRDCPLPRQPSQPQQQYASDNSTNNNSTRISNTNHISTNNNITPHTLMLFAAVVAVLVVGVVA
jgi:hypothetical protein